MDRIIFAFAFSLSLVISQEASALPIIDRYYKILSEEEALIQTGAAGQRVLDPKSIKAFVWNIKKTQESGWKQEFQNYGQNKDLFLIQEAYQSSLFNNTTQSFTGVRWDFGASFLYRMYNDAATGTAIGSIADPTEVFVKHSPDDEPVVGTPKSMTFAKYPLNGYDEELLVISVHGINITTFGSFKRQMAQAETAINLHQGPIIFAGDFNTRTKERTTYLMQLVKRLKLEEIKFKYAEYRMAWKFTNNYLDHGFVRGLSVKNAQVLKDSRGSDHRPLIFEASMIE